MPRPLSTVPPDRIDKALIIQRNVVVVHSFSKAYGLAGLRLGPHPAPEVELPDGADADHVGEPQPRVELALRGQVPGVAQGIAAPHRGVVEEVFDELSGIETVQVMSYAARAIQIAE